MAFFYEQSAAEARQAKRGATRVIPIELMRAQGCSACPLDEVDKRRKTPKFKPSGSARPVVYIIDQYPSEQEDAEGEHLRGETGKLIRSCIPRGWWDDVRVNYAVKCRPVDDKGPGLRESTCCTKHTDADIERTRPKVVVGLGEMPLRWALGGTGAPDSVWRGRMFPIKVGDHVCHYYQVQSPAFIVRMQKERSYDTEFTLQFRADLEALFAALEKKMLGTPAYVEADERDRGIICIDGSNEVHLDVLRMELESMLGEPYIGIDIETNMIRPYAREPLIATCAVASTTRAVSFSIDHPRGWPENMRKAIKHILVEFIQRSGNKVAHNLSFEMEWFGQLFDPSLLRSSHWEDSMAAAHTIDERRGKLSLGMTTQLLFGFDVKTLSPVNPKFIMTTKLSDVLRYNALDAMWCLRAFLAMHKTISSDDQLLWEYNRKVRLIPALVRAQIKGLVWDPDYAEKMRVMLEEERASAWSILHRCKEVKAFEEHTGRKFEATDDDVQVLLRDVMKREEGQRAMGTYSGDESVLSAIPAHVSIAPAQILRVRSTNKLESTYITPLLKCVTEKGNIVVHDDGLIHTNYNTMVAVSGRLSADDPNVHNYPKRKHKEIRGVIVAPAGYVFVACDYGQIEARVIAMASRDKALTDAMWTNYDIHAFWAQRFLHHYPRIKDWVVDEFEVDWDEKGLKTLRQEAKNKWVFPMFFGSSHRSCAASLHVPEEVAEDVRDEFWDTFAGVKKWQDRLVKRYRETMSVQTLTGRHRRGPMSLNEIINTPIQGTAADIFTDALVRTSEYAEIHDIPDMEAPINVHDDLSFYVRRERLVDDVDRIAKMMCEIRFDFINVPLVVEVSTSNHHWHDMKEVGIYRSDELGYHKR